MKHLKIVQLALLWGTLAAALGKEANEAVVNEPLLLGCFELHGKVVDVTPDISEQAFQTFEKMQSEAINRHKQRWSSYEDYVKYVEAKYNGRDLAEEFWKSVSTQSFERPPSVKDFLKFLASFGDFIEYERGYLSFTIWGPWETSNALVTLVGPSCRQTVTTDEHGNFRFTGLPKGDYEISAEAFSRVAGRKASGRLRFRFVPGRTQNLDVNVHAYAITIAGRVTDEKGIPVAAARVSARPALVFPEFDYEEEQREQAWQYEISALSSTDGSYSISGIEPPHLDEIKRYIGGGEHAVYAYEEHRALSRFFYQVQAEKDGMRQWNDIIVPLVIEPLACAARRMFNLEQQGAEQLHGSPASVLHEYGDVPQSTESTIYGVDIVLHDANLPVPRYFKVEGEVWELIRDLREENFARLEAAYAAAMKVQEESKGLSEAQRAKQLEDCYRRYAEVWTNMMDPKRVPRALVVLQGAALEQQTVAKMRGDFRFVDVPEGEYDIIAEAPSPGATGKKARGRVRVYLDADSRTRVGAQIHILADPLKIKGRVRTAMGQPVAGARVTAGPACVLRDVSPEESARLRRKHRFASELEQSTISQSDGSYELDGFKPCFPLDIADYLAMGAEAMIATNSYWYPFNPNLVDVHVTADGYVQRKEQVPRVPLMTEDDVCKARRLAAVYLPEAICILGCTPQSIPKTVDGDAGRLWPSIDGDVIRDVDIVLDPVAGAAKGAEDAVGSKSSARSQSL